MCRLCTGERHVHSAHARQKELGFLGCNLVKCVRTVLAEWDVFPLAGGIKLLEFKVKGSKPGRQFSAEISLLGGGVSVAAQFASKIICLLTLFSVCCIGSLRISQRPGPRI